VSTALARLSPADLNDALVEFVQPFYDDPLGFVESCYPWGEPGTMLEHHEGPDAWQREFLIWLGGEVRQRGFTGRCPVMPIRGAVSKGHGVGGSVLIAWLVDWIMSTRPHAQGVVTANTAVQLETKTWATIQRWTGLCLTGRWFTINSARMYHPAFKDSWFCSPQTCREENSEAFAGQHAADSTSFYLFDEDSAIPDIIHTVAEGGLTDGEPMMFRLGNPTRNSGDFWKCCFGSGRDVWHPVVVDSRTSRFSNKQLIQEWVDEYGEDSDFVRVRVRGLPPRASEIQFIDQQRVWDAQKRPNVVVLPDEALVAGADFSGGGKAWNVVRFRRGLDGRSIPPIRVPGEHTRDDRSGLLAILAGILQEREPSKRVAHLFCDAAYGAPYVERLKSMGFTNVSEVNGGSTHTPDRHQANMRAYMWNRMKEWLAHGTIPTKDERLESDFIAPGFHLNKSDALVLESKESMQKRNVDSPDDADALAYTFAAPVVQPWKTRTPAARRAAFEGRRGVSGDPTGLAWMG
jgi:hypothetical protein